VGENDACLIKRVMDAGAYGVIVPNVSSVEDAKKAVAAVKYPPVGTRGVGLYRAQGFGRHFEEYKKWLDQESVVIIQIEHIDALAEIDQIFAVQGVDAFMIGPYDLSASMGKPGAFNDPQVKKAIEQILAAAKRQGIVAGFHVVPPDARLLQEKIKQGFRFLAFSLDSMWMGQAAETAMKGLKR
jgi:2-dehydro-3-deoxyglucarate aldolase